MCSDVVVWVIHSLHHPSLIGCRCQVINGWKTAQSHISQASVFVMWNNSKFNRMLLHQRSQQINDVHKVNECFLLFTLQTSLSNQASSIWQVMYQMETQMRATQQLKEKQTKTGTILHHFNLQFDLSRRIVRKAKYWLSDSSQ